MNQVSSSGHLTPLLIEKIFHLWTTLNWFYPYQQYIQDRLCFSHEILISFFCIVSRMFMFLPRVILIKMIFIIEPFKRRINLKSRKFDKNVSIIVRITLNVEFFGESIYTSRSILFIFAYIHTRLVCIWHIIDPTMKRIFYCNIMLIMKVLFFPRYPLPLRFKFSLCDNNIYKNHLN